MDVKVDAENITTVGTILGGFVALWGIVAAFARRQRLKGERWAKLEGRVDGHDREFTDLKSHIDTRFDTLELLITNRSK